MGRFPLHYGAAACWAILLALAPPSQAQDAARKVPILYCTDLFHPHDDPDDHFDLATLFAIEEFDIRGIVLEQGVKQLERPGKIPLEQMMRLTGRRVPYEVGLGERLKGPDDDGRDQPGEFQKGVELILDALRTSPEKVTIFTTGSLRDLAAAYNRDRDLFRRKAGRVYINIGDSYFNIAANGAVVCYNVRLDVHAWVSVMRSALPIYWCACREGGPYMHGRRYATMWQLPQKRLMEAPPPLQNYFVYALSWVEGDDPLAYLSRPLSREKMYRVFRLRLSPGRSLRDMWCTAPMLHAAGREVIETAKGGWASLPGPQAGPAAHKLYTFIPVRVSVDDRGAPAIDFNGKGPGREMFLFKLLDMKSYDEAMTGCLLDLFRRMRSAGAAEGGDPRDVRNGHLIPDENYCDQPYVVATKDGNWLCVLTTGPGKEGAKGQHVVSTISTDKGKTWSKLVDIEPSDGWKETSWAIPLVTPTGRVYVFYDYNGENIRTLPDGAPISQPDALGWYCYKYSDDGGRTWSAERYRLPLPMTACDRANNWSGKVQIFWGIDKPKIIGDGVTFAFTKLGRFMFENGEGWFFRSDNILTETDPTKLHWTILPDGDHGLRAPEFGSIQEEHNMVPLGGGKLYCVYRTATGYPCHAYSNDGGRNWTKPEQMTYTPGGQRIKNPRACPKLWRTADGRFLFWFHNHSGRDHKGRNPVWITGGAEKDGAIHWAQPEILLYDKDARIQGMSYPDLIEQDGRYWVTETQKTEARVHEIDKTLLEGLWRQGRVKTVTRKSLIFERLFTGDKAGDCNVPRAVNLTKTGGLTLDCWIQLDDLAPGQTILEDRRSNGKLVALTTTEGGAVRLTLSDGKTTAAWDCDPGLLQAGKLHHVVAIADAGPRIITFVADGVLCDGGQSRIQGWGRWEGTLGTVLDAGELTVNPALKSLRIYDRYLRTSEAIGNFQAGAM